MLADEWLSYDGPLTREQRSVLKRLRRLLGESRLPHLKRHRCTVAILENGTAMVTIGHDRTPEVELVVYALADGRVEVWCDALGEMVHWDFDPREHDDAVEVVALVLHGWARSVVIFEGSELRSVTEELDRPDEPSLGQLDDATLTAIHGRGRPLRIERRSVSWASTKQPRVDPP